MVTFRSFCGLPSMLLVISLSIASFIYLGYFTFRESLRLFKVFDINSANNFDYGQERASVSSNGEVKDSAGPPLKSNTLLKSDKALYHCLQNLERYPNALQTARNRLLSLLDETVSTALKARPGDSSILSITKYSPSAIYDFFAKAETRTTTKFESYLSRRRQGGDREIFPNLEYAKWWLRTAAPVKYVDGAWLGGIHRAFNTLPRDRASQRIAWQILSEELGDGDLAKNHVWVYQKLMESIDANIGTGDEEKFIDNSQNPNNEERVWKAAVAQLCVSLWPEDFLPEILGFNMAYESLPLHLLITIQELRELKLDPYYFVLHVSIDNGHSGHAAMGIKAVVEYIGSLQPSKIEVTWRRVQAGVILAEGLATTPKSPSTLDCRVEKIFGEKCITARPMHACCPAKIGGKSGRSLSQWLDHKVYRTHSLAFLRALAESRWVVRGSPEQSKLIKELQWGGRMFGAFTSNEVGVLKDWIEGLAYPAQKSREGAYLNFVGRDFANPSRQLSHDDFIQSIPPSIISESRGLADLLSSSPHSGTMTTSRFFLLLRLSAVPFERMPSYPAKCATPQGMAAVKILRALHGFQDTKDLCAGMDDVCHLGHNCGIYSISEHPCIFREPEGPVRKVSEWVCSMSKAPARNYSSLLGAQLSFVVNLFWNEGLLKAGILNKRDIETLRAIGDQCVVVSREVLDLCDWNDVVRGFCTIRYKVGCCVVDASLAA